MLYGIINTGYPKSMLITMAIAAMHKSWCYDEKREKEVRFFNRRVFEHLAVQAAMEAEAYFRHAKETTF